MEADELLAWLSPPADLGRQPFAGSEPSAVVEDTGYFHRSRRCTWSFAVLDHRHRLALPVSSWAGAELVMVASAGSLVVAEWRWFSGRSSVAGGESLEARTDARCRLTLPGGARAHLDAHAGDPIAIGVEESGGVAVHLVGPARFERSLGGWS